MAAVQTCTVPAPSAMNSAASRQVVMPPMPEIGRPRRLAVAGDLGDHVERDRLHRRAAIAAMGALAVDRSAPARSCRDRPLMIELMVLISETASAPPCLRRARRVADVGDVRRQLDDDRHARVLLAPARHHLDVFRHLADRRAHAALAHAVRAAEIELDAVAAGLLDQRQDRLPVGSSHGTISETTSARSGQSRLTCLISRRLTSSGRSVISSMLLRPMQPAVAGMDRAIARTGDVDDRRVLAERLPDHAAPARLEGAHDVVVLVGRRRRGEPERVRRFDADETGERRSAMGRSLSWGREAVRRP